MPQVPLPPSVAEPHGESKLTSASGSVEDELRAQLRQTEAERDAYKTALAKWSERGVPAYDGDLLATWNKNLTFLNDDRFKRAYWAGMDSGHSIGREKGSRTDIHIEYRIAMCCWAGWHAKQLRGDFVECGTNTGIMSLAICDYIGFGGLDKTFYLFDTFAGIPVEQLNSAEIQAGRGVENAMYEDCFETAKANFAKYPNATLVRGKVPDTLTSVPISEVAYLCIDMNIAYPERAALEYFWPKLVTGGVVIFDDYGWMQCRRQKETIDELTRSWGVEVWTLPTGQGLLIKP